MHRFVPHTGELELELEAEQPAGVFVDAALALADLIGDERGDPLSLRVRVEAADRASLLVEWLNELVFLAETEGLVAEELGELELRERTVEATITGRRAETRHSSRRSPTTTSSSSVAVTGGSRGSSSTSDPSGASPDAWRPRRLTAPSAESGGLFATWGRVPGAGGKPHDYSRSTGIPHSAARMVS